MDFNNVLEVEVYYSNFNLLYFAHFHKKMRTRTHILLSFFVFPFSYPVFRS
ncbi:Uncharacterised protein [Streptococcus pneumoniae]|nr:Uncharacterised protein [Streptococcus pneumoniae]